MSLGGEISSLTKNVPAFVGYLVDKTSIDQSVVVPLLIVVFGSAALVWARAGTAPTGSLVFGLIGSAVYLVLAYSLLYLAISSLSRSLGSGLLSSVMFFLLFGFFWSLIAVLIANLGRSIRVGRIVPSHHDYATLLACRRMPTASLLFHLRTSVRTERVDRSATSIALALDSRCGHDLDNYSAIFVCMGNEIPGVAVMIFGWMMQKLAGREN